MKGIATDDILRWMANSQTDAVGAPSMPELKKKVEHDFPWIFDAASHSDDLIEWFEPDSSVEDMSGYVGVVKVGTHKKGGHKVACKYFNRTLKREDLLKPNDYHMVGEWEFLRELYFLFLLPESRENCRLYKAFLTETHMILMMSLHGKPLSSLIAKSPLSTKEAVLYTKRIIEQSLELIKLGIWHCDIKPENLLLNEGSYSLTFIDFGFSFGANTVVDIGNPFWINPHLGPELNIEGVFLPEEVMVWSIGDILYRMITSSPKTNIDFLTPAAKREVMNKEYSINSNWPEEISEFLKAIFVPPSNRPSLSDLLNFDLFK